MELDTRQLDEGDLFGVRALQSGHGGGVAHSRPTSVAGSVLSQGSGDGNHLSSTLVATTPASSVTALQPSQLAHNAMSTDDIRRSETLSAQHSLPTSPRFLPSERDSSGRINHNLAINMSQGVPASPVSPSRPPAAHSLCESRSPSPAFPFPRMPRDDDFANQPALRPGMPLDARRSSSRTVPTSENHESDIKSQSGSIISRSTSAKSNLKRTSLSNHRVRSYQPDYVQFPARPAGAVQADRPLSNGSDHPLRTSSLPRVASKYPPVENQGKKSNTKIVTDED